MRKESQEYAGLHGLVLEVKRGEQRKDVLSSSALEFTEERQAQHFSYLRENMKSEMARIVMEKGQQLDELTLLKRWRGHEDV